MSSPTLLSGPYMAVVHPDEMTDTTPSGADRVLRVARVEFAGARRRGRLSDGSELGGIHHATVSQYAGGASVTLGLDLPVADAKGAV